MKVGELPKLKCHNMTTTKANKKNHLLLGVGVLVSLESSTVDDDSSSAPLVSSMLGVPSFPVVVSESTPSVPVVSLANLFVPERISNMST